MAIIMTSNLKHRIRFEPDGAVATVEAGASILDAATAVGIRFSASCGGAGTCGACRVIIKEGQTESPSPGRISPADFARGVRQACQSQALSDLVVEIPPVSRLPDSVFAQKEAADAAWSGPMTAKGWSFAPVVDKVYVKLTPPSPNEHSSDLDRLLKGLRSIRGPEPIEVSLDILRQLSATLRASDWQLTATLLSNHNPTQLIRLEPGDTRAQNYALAFDIGTTAVRGQLLDLACGRVLAEAASYNGQISYGADVISRILHAQKPGGLDTLQQAMSTTLNKLIRELLEATAVGLQDVNHLMIAANTVMVHLLLAIDPQYLRLSPYVPTLCEAPPVRGSELGLDVANHACVSFLPSVASYVGGDIVAGIIGTGIYQTDKVTLYIDIGTNGEIVAGNRDWLVTAAASAGPTFEGGGIQHGMLATSGAIDGFELNKKTGEPTVTTIESGKPRGICGAGLINITAVMLRTGLIEPGGKFNLDIKTPRLRAGASGREYVLVWGRESQTGDDIVITEIDLDNLIRAKAAIFAGCQTLLGSLGSDFDNLDQVVIAGNFGRHLNIENAVAIGLLPDLPRDKFIFAGNGSLLGGRLCSYSVPLFREAAKVSQLMTGLELSENPDFMGNYVAAMFLPHTDMHRLFPSVMQGRPL